MWVTSRVSPSTTRSNSSKRPPRSFLGSAGFLGSDISQGAAGADQPLHLQVQILVLRLSDRDPGVTVERHPAATPGWNGLKYTILPGRNATGFSSHPLSYDK